MRSRQPQADASAEPVSGVRSPPWERTVLRAPRPQPAPLLSSSCGAVPLAWRQPWQTRCAGPAGAPSSPAPHSCQGSRCVSAGAAGGVSGSLGPGARLLPHHASTVCPPHSSVSALPQPRCPLLLELVLVLTCPWLSFRLCLDLTFPGSPRWFSPSCGCHRPFEAGSSIKQGGFSAHSWELTQG